jgi:hypothetical protein
MKRGDAVNQMMRFFNAETAKCRNLEFYSPAKLTSPQMILKVIQFVFVFLCGLCDFALKILWPELPDVSR